MTSAKELSDKQRNAARKEYILDAALWCLETVFGRGQQHLRYLIQTQIDTKTDSERAQLHGDTGTQ